MYYFEVQYVFPVLKNITLYVQQARPRLWDIPKHAWKNIIIIQKRKM